jgi:hypothetical protein
MSQFRRHDDDNGTIDVDIFSHIVKKVRLFQNNYQLNKAIEDYTSIRNNNNMIMYEIKSRSKILRQSNRNSNQEN